MKTTSAKKTSKTSPSPAAASSTSTSDIEKSREAAFDAASQQAAIAGSPTADELAKEKPGAHKCKPVKIGGDKNYVCQAPACGFSTFNPETAREHERRPR